jgi:hypothetical protein
LKIVCERGYASPMGSEAFVRPGQIENRSPASVLASKHFTDSSICVNTYT